MHPLKLVAFDKDDINIVSAHVQDAVLKIADIHWMAAQHRLVLALNRFDWEEALEHDDIGSNRSNVMNVIDSNHLERDYREKPVPAFSHPALGYAPGYHRRRAALRFDRVKCLKSKRVSPAEPDAVLNLLAVDFVDDGSGGGVVTLTFSEGAALRLEVECLECELADLGPVWETTCCPSHTETVVEQKAAGERG